MACALFSISIPFVAHKKTLFVFVTLEMLKISYRVQKFFENSAFLALIFIILSLYMYVVVVGDDVVVVVICIGCQCDVVIAVNIPRGASVRQKPTETWSERRCCTVCVCVCGAVNHMLHNTYA